MYQKRILVQKVNSEVCGGRDDKAYQDNESHELNWFIEQDDGSGLQRHNLLGINLEVVNDNILSLETMNDYDDDSIYDDIGEENGTLDEYANEGEK